MKKRALIKKDPTERDYECYLALGKKRQGKSSLMADLINEYLKIHGEAWKDTPVKAKIFAHALSDSRAFEKIPDIVTVKKSFGEDSEFDVLKKCDKWGNNKYWKMTNALKSIGRKKADIQSVHETLSEHFRYGFALFDEWTVYATTKPPTWATDLAFNHANYQLDCFFACHKLIKVPKDMSDSDVFTKIFVFKTGENKPNEYEFDRFSCGPLLREAFYIVKEAKPINNVVQYHCLVDTIEENIREWNFETGEYQLMGEKPFYLLK